MDTVIIKMVIRSIDQSEGKTHFYNAIIFLADRT